MNLRELKQLGKDKLIKNNINDAIIKADILLQFVTNLNKIELISNYDNKINEKLKYKYLSFIDEIIDGKPIQYITKQQEFMKIKFSINENVLIPQPDTEILVEIALKEINKKNDREINILDLCTGSGAIAISIDKYIEKIQNDNRKIKIYASDISEKALELAKYNAVNNNSKVNFILSDMFKNIRGKFDIIISNPPYIETETIKKLSKEVQKEPHIALDGGKDGLNYYRILAHESYKYLKSNGVVLLEIGYNQKEKVIELINNQACYLNVECLKDLNGNNRVIKFNVN